MSANATGTPTSNFSIPKFNTASDAPNGKGTNEMMDAIDTLLLNRITPTIPNSSAKVYAGDGVWRDNRAAITGANIGVANVDVNAPTAYSTFMEIGVGGGSIRSIGAPPSAGTTFTFQNRAFGTQVTFLHNTAGGTGQKIFLNGDASYSIGFEDTISFTYDGTNWVESSRSVTTAKSYTPTWSSTGTQPALGNGTLTGTYIALGKLVFATFALSTGSTTTYGTGAYTISLPFTAATGIDGGKAAGAGIMYNSGGAGVNNILWRSDGTIILNQAAFSTVSQGGPITLASGATMTASICYIAT